MRSAAVLLVLTLAVAAPAAPRLVGDSEVKPGGFALLAVEGAGKTVLWTVTPEPVQEAELAGSLVFTGKAGTTYTATAILIDFERKTAEKLKHAVRFLGPGPDPGPGPPPV